MAGDPSLLLSVDGVNQYYGGSHILRDVSFAARAGEVTVVLGRNGVGKTTLLKCLMGLIPVKSGEVRWQTKTDGGMTSGVIVVEGKVLSGRACSPVGANCYIAAHDAKTGKELWRFRTAATDSDPGGASWAGSPGAWPPSAWRPWARTRPSSA